MINIEFLILLLPFLSSVIVGFSSSSLKEGFALFISCSTMVLVAIFGWYLFIGHLIDPVELYKVKIGSWITSGDLTVNWTLRWDSLSILMTMVVTTVSAIVHIYSVGYMKGDPGNKRFFSYLSFFTFSMLVLVTSDNILQLFVGWEGVGLSSYLLIGFWYHKASATAAAMKAFIVNRVGDIAFALGIVLLYLSSGNLSFDSIFIMSPFLGGQAINIAGIEFDLVTVICILLFIGACGKSAQLGLHTWLPDAMEGPTPVSALIHAATMVTAGVFLVVRMSPLFEMSEFALNTVAIVGGLTAFFAATIAMTQTDIKRVIAYSTCSQLGYMFLACGVSAYPAAMYHLTTHAFFKALLFLGAGSVIHACSNEQNMQKMGGLRSIIPVTFIYMLIGTFAITGFPLFAGYFSKDLIIESIWASGSNLDTALWLLATLTAGMTAFYSWRLIALVFFGAPRSDEHTLAHAHESPYIMLSPLLVLALGAVVSGYIFYPYFSWHGYVEGFWQGAITIFENHTGFALAEETPTDIKLMPLILSGLGFIFVVIIYSGGKGLRRAEKISQFFAPLYKLSFNKWYFDEIYNAIFVRPLFALAKFIWVKIDLGTIDRFGPDGIAIAIKKQGNLLSKMQSGKIYHYSFTMLSAIAILIAVIFIIHS